MFKTRQARARQRRAPGSRFARAPGSPPLTGGVLRSIVCVPFFVWAFVSGLVFLASLAACGPTPSDDASRLAGDRADGSARDGAAPAENVTVRVALHGDPSSLDPHLQAEVIAQAVLGNIYEPLVTFDRAMRPRPLLAESWTNPDELTWRFRLRPGLRFHDGRPLGVDDVVASLERVRSHPGSRQSGSLVAVDEVVAIDDRHLEVRTHAPYAILLSKLAFVAIVPADVPQEIEHPMGSGPYRFAERRHRSSGTEPGMIRLEKVPGHRRGHGAPAVVEYLFVADRDERIEGLLGGRFDLVDELALGDVGQIQARESVRLESLTSLAVTYLQIDPTRPPFDDRRVRLAVHLALDRWALVDEVYGGYARPAGQMVSQNVFGHDPDLEPPRRDLAAVRTLLAEAGRGDGLRLELEVREGRPTTDHVRRQLAEAGIEVTVVERPWSEMYARLQRGEVGFYLGGWVCTSGDAGDLFDAKVHSPDPELGYGRANFIDYSDPELDRLIERANAAHTLSQRGRLLRRALRLLAEDLVYLPLYSPEEVYGLRQRIRWTPRPDGRIYGFELTVAERASEAPRPR